MGVTNLWPVLEPVQVHQTLSSLKGQTLAVDLSIWVCETQCVRQMQGVVSKPFLRNLFFRISHLLQLGIHLVFVIEGKAPDLKHQVMAKRQESRYSNRKAVGGQRRGGRRNFNACLRECCEMLDYLGVPYVQSPGEAESTCAALNANGIVDGCLTNDGDAFLYGARTVYRNFTMNTKDPHVECYSMTDVEERLGLTREKLVAMALLLGCDYLPKGVPGVGVERAVKLMNLLTSNILERFEMWKCMSETSCVDKVEVFIRRKAVMVPDFPQKEVVQEFLQSGKKCPTCVSKWSRPSMADLQVFCDTKLEWPVEYTLEKVLPLITLWDMIDISNNNPPSDRPLVPRKILKSRIKQGISCYEVLWTKPATDCVCSEDLYRTIEEQTLFGKSYPQVVAEFEREQADKKTKGKGRKSRKKTSSRSKEREDSELTEKLEAANGAENDIDDVEGDDADEMLIKEDLDSEIRNTQTHSEHVDKPDTSLPNIPVNIKQQMKASPMHRLELAMRSVTKQLVKERHVAVERNLNFSSSEEEEEEEHLPLSQRLQLKIAKSRAQGLSVHQSPPQGLAGGGDDVMVRAISQGVSSAALKDNFSSDSDTEDLYSFPSHPERKNIQEDVAGNMVGKDDSKNNYESAVNVNGSDDEIQCEKLKTLLPGNCDNHGASSMGTPIWQQSFVNSKSQKLDKTEFLDMPKLNFTAVTPELQSRSESSAGIRTEMSASTPDSPLDCVSRFSHNLSNLSPHLSEDVMVSPFLKSDSLQSPIDSWQKPQGSLSVSALWDNMSFNNTKAAIDFGNFEVQTSLLNSFSKLNITDGELSSVMNSFHEKVSKTPSENNIHINEKHPKTQEIKECSNNSQDQGSVIILNNNDSIYDSNEDGIQIKKQTNNRDKKHKDPSQMVSALRTINRQSTLSKSPQIGSSKDKTRVPSLNSPVCGGKENALSDRGEECSRQSPMSLIERLRQRLGNHTDSSIINNIKYGPLSVKPVK